MSEFLGILWNVRTCVSRVMREIEAVKQEAALLQEQMGVVKQDIQKVVYSFSHMVGHHIRLMLN